MKATTVKQTLIAAHWILTHYGWCQDSYFVDDQGQAIWYGSKYLGGCCLSGALVLVETEDSNYRFDAELLLLKVSNTSQTHNIAVWNDIKGRTKDQVLELLNQAIEKA
jgi:hypothetical protein